MNPYIPGEFTLLEYEKLLQLAASQFKFIKYTEIEKNNKFILWRHDIDMSLEQAVQLAQIESRNQVQACYFIHLHNEFYNALDSSSLELIKEIISYNHVLGLHFDTDYYNIQSIEQLNFWLKFEKNILEILFQQEIKVFSFHNPNEYSLNCEEEMYAGMINTYSSYFKKQVNYCSDSNGYWRYKKLIDVLNDPLVTQLQVLTHPEWWTKEELLPREKVVHYTDFRKQSVIKNYDDALRMAGRVNIGMSSSEIV